MWVMRSIGYRLHRVHAELCWLDRQIAVCTQERGSDTVRSRRRAQPVPTPCYSEKTDNREELT
ncbi:MAG TPA: hypothetical protein VEL31_08970 [Ktedonobacteraceae bacterium]|nr:hypothetical protein [Ktedonobacteraceae bacterium]